MIPTKDPEWYWQEEAVPPATCAQAKAVLPKMMKSDYLNAGTVMVSGWRCSWERAEPYLTGNVVCTKGAGTVRAVYLHREK